MAVKLNYADLQYILRQIEIAEAHSSGIPLTELRVAADGALLTDRSLYHASTGAWLGDTAAPRAIPDPHVPYGLRAVDGSNNNIVPDRETWGAAGEPMPQLLQPRFLNDADGDSMSFGPGQPTITNNNYGVPGSVADADPRTISNLIVDVTLNNPAAIVAALTIAGSADVIVDQQRITSAFEALRDARIASPTGDHSVLQATLDTALEETGVSVTKGSIDVLNVSPDEGLSKPFNAWMTFFGQFFDHGLDLISKGGNGTVYVPLTADDPLIAGKDGITGTADDLPAHLRFMTLTRSTPVDGSQRNVTTPFVDQNQTYTSNPSHQVFLREYALVDGRPQSTGRLLGGADGGLATWADVKFQAKTMLGIDLQDSDVGSVPMLQTDAYGEFVRGANGLPKIMVGVAPGGAAVYATGSLVPGQELKLAAIQLPVGTQLVGSGGAVNTIDAGETVGAARTFNAFLDDIAHTAVPVLVGGVLQQDADTVFGNAVAASPTTGRNLEYDNELLDRHYATGDGRGNENIGLTAVHHVFHSEHNRQVDAQKLTILQSGDLAFVREWVTSPITQTTLDAIKTGLAAATNKAAFFAQLEDGDLSTGVAGVQLAWDGERLFQAGRFATEMQYQHLVFEEFARKVQPLVDPFVFNSVTEINPAIFAEFANTVYRFGHSMLTENMPRLGPDGETLIHVGADGQPLTGDLGLIDAFLNPVLFDNNGAMSHDEGAAAIIRGMTIERGAEIDEFVVDALRNNLLGLPLDLPALNIARGRETGTPSLNDARGQLYAATQSTFLTPYKSWVEMAGNLKNPMSIVNFIAAYGTHSSVLSATTLEAKRDAAMSLVFGGTDAPADRLDFVNGRGGWTGGETGLNLVDLWVGGLAEKQMPFGGMLGSTFNAIFEAQLENLQDADRFYYLTRVQGQNFLNELEQNSFSKLLLANTSLAEAGADGIRGTEDDIVQRHIGVDAFADYDYELEVNIANQLDQNGAAPGKDPTGNNFVLEAMGLGKVARDDPGTTAVETNYVKFTGGEHVLVGGTAGNDTIITDFGDDAIWGDAGDDRIESGAGVDLVNGGAGDDIITDSGDSGDFLKGEEGNDVIANSNGIDILMGGRGKDVIFVGVDDTEVFGGEGDDFMLGGDGVNLLLGNEGNDWMEAGGGFDTTAGDNSELFFNSKIVGHDVMFAGSDEHDFDGESGDDIMVQGESVMRNEGMFGFDWAIFKGNARDAHADMRIPIFTTEEADILRNRFDKTEALSGWENDDTLIGDDRTAADAAAEEVGAATVGANENVFFGDGLDQAGIDRIAGLGQIVSVGANGFFEAGNILLGGAGNDTLTGNGGNDILDGDRWLNVRIRITRPDNPATAGTNEATVDTAGNQLTSVDSLKHIFTAAQVAQEGLPAAWSGKSLFELMVSRDIRPEQMHIVREIVTTGVSSSDVDTATFGDIRSNYTITRGVGGAVIVSHTTITTGLVDDGTDTLRNIEKLQFTDGSVDVALILNQPFERLNIVAANGDVGTLSAVFTGLEAGRAVSLQWQILGANGVWRNVTGTEGTLRNNGTAFSPAAALSGSEFRVVANWTSTLPGFGPQVTASVETGIVGTAADEDLAGSTAPNVILGLAGDDDIEGDIGNDVIDGGDGDDRLDGGDGDDTLRGNDGADVLIGRTGNNTLDGGADDDILSGGHGNDAIDGGTGTDTAIVSGPVEAYAFERTAAGILVTDNLGVEGDGVDTLRNVELLQVGDIDVYALGAQGTAAADIVVGTAGNDTLSGGASNDLIFAGAGADVIRWQVGDGRDFVDGGAGNDTFRVLGGGPVQQFTLAEARAAFPALVFRADTEKVVVQGGVVIAELKNVEQIGLNSAATGTPVLVDPTPTNGLVSPTQGASLSVNLAAIQDADGLGTFSVQWQASNNGGATWTNIGGATAATFTPGQAQVGGLVRASVSFTDGGGSLEQVVSAPSGVVGARFQGTNGLNSTFNGTSGDDIATGSSPFLGAFGGNDTLNGNAGNDILNGAGGNDTVNGGTGNDLIVQASNAGRDRIDGGGDTDTYQLNGSAGAETFRIYTRAAWLSVAGNTAAQLGNGAEIVITRNGTNNASVIAELDNIEEIFVNTLDVTTPGGPAGGAVGGDTVVVIGNFSGTSLALNTITIDGETGNDIVDISSLSSAHRIVFRSNGGNDTIVGSLRAQDVIELPAGQALSDYSLSDNANGTKTLSNGSHSITFAGSILPQFKEAAAGGSGAGGNTGGGDGGGEGVTGAFDYTAGDIDALEAMVRGQRPASAGDDDVPVGVRDLSGTGNNVDHPTWGSADQAFIRLTEAHYGAVDAFGNRAINPIFDGLDPREISNILGQQEAGLPHAGNDANIFFMAMGQYIDHGLDFLPKGGNGTVAIGAPGGGAPGSGNPADLTRGTVLLTDAEGVPQHKNQTSPFVDQNQAYGSNGLVGQFLRESDGAHGHGMRLLAGASDPSNPDFKLLPTLRELLQHHWDADTVFTGAGLPGGSIGFRAYYTNFVLSQGTSGTLFDAATGAYDPQVVNSLISNFMGSGHPLLLDTNPFVNVLDHFVAGDGRANENFALTSIHTIWARNHNFHVEKLLAAGFEGTAEEVFQAAKMVNEAEYQRVVFDEYLDTLIGGLRSPGTHGFDEYDPNVDSGISHEFAAAVFRFGHSLIGQTMEVRGADGQTQSVNLFDAFLNPSNDPSVFKGPLPPGYVPQPGYAQHGVGNIIAGTVGQAAEDVDFNIVDAVRNDLVRIRADLFAFNVARGWDVGLGTLNQVRMDLAKSTNAYIEDAVGFAGGDLSAYSSWADFQARNGLTDQVIDQFKQAYPDLVLAAADIAAFRSINPDIEIAMRADGTGSVKGIDRVDLWVGGLAEKHINEGIVGQTFWVVLHEQFDRLQDGDRFYYLSRFENFDFYESFIDGQEFADIITRNTGLENLPERVFETDDEDGGSTGEEQPGDGDDDGDDDGDVDGPIGEGDGDGDDEGDSDDDDDDDGDGDVDGPVDDGDGDSDADGDGDSGGSDDDEDDEDDGDDDGDTDGGPDGGSDGDGSDDDDDDDDGPVVTPPPTVPPVVPAGQSLMGTANGDTLTTGAGDDAVLALDGDDLVTTGAGADTVTAGGGGDLVKLGAGADVAFGGAGNDQIFGGEGGDLILGEAGDDALFGEAGDDMIEGGSGSDDVFAGAGDDTVLATRGDGDDTYWGEAGVDTLDYSAISANLRIDLGTGTLNRGFVASTQSGEDVVYSFENVLGGSGNDQIIANTHVNVMDGGAGNDTFVFRSAAAADGDVITGFQPGDKIDLSAMSPSQPLSLVTGSSFTATGQVMVTHETRDDGDHTLVLGNLSANGGPEFTIDIQGRHHLTTADFQGVG